MSTHVRSAVPSEWEPAFITFCANQRFRRPVSKRVNSSKTDADDPTLIEPIRRAPA